MALALFLVSTPILPFKPKIIKLLNNQVSSTRHKYSVAKSTEILRTALCEGGEVFELQETEAPPRAGMATVSLISYNYILFFTGQTFSGHPADAHGDVLLLNTATLKWYTCPTKGAIPTPRAWPTTTLSSDGQKVVMFGGGFFTTAWKQQALFADLRVLELRTLTWVTPLATGIAPSARAGHVAGCIGNKVIITLGGNLGGTVIFGDTFELDVRTWHWSEITFTDTNRPSSMGSASAVVVDDCFYIVFGWKGANQLTSNIIYCLRRTDKTWSRTYLVGDISSRSAMSVELIGGSLVMAFGISDTQHLLDNVLVAKRRLKPSPVSFISLR